MRVVGGELLHFEELTIKGLPLFSRGKKNCKKNNRLNDERDICY